MSAIISDKQLEQLNEALRVDSFDWCENFITCKKLAEILGLKWDETNKDYGTFTRTAKDLLFEKIAAYGHKKLGRRYEIAGGDNENVGFYDDFSETNVIIPLRDILTEDEIKIFNGA